VTLLLADLEVRAPIDMTSIIRALDRGSADRAAASARLNTEIDGRWISMRPTIISPIGVLRSKRFHGHPNYGARFHVVPNSMNSSEAPAAMDGTYLTPVLAAAASSVAAPSVGQSATRRLGAACRSHSGPRSSRKPRSWHRHERPMPAQVSQDQEQGIYGRGC
jgi:hypothetical protein